MTAAELIPVLVLPAAVWAPCPTCWGQGRIFQDHNGEGLVPAPCETCLGLGQRIVD